MAALTHLINLEAENKQSPISASVLEDNPFMKSDQTDFTKEIELNSNSTFPTRS